MSLLFAAVTAAAIVGLVILMSKELSTPDRPARPGWVVVYLLLLVAAFHGLLYFLSDVFA